MTTDEIQQETNVLKVKTVSLEDAKNLFQTFQKNQPKAKGTETLIITPDWNTLSQKQLFYTDAMLTKVDVKINRAGNFITKLLFIEVNDEIKNVLYTLYIDSMTADGNLQNARIYLTELNGEYIDGYRFVNGLIKTRILPKKESDDIASKNTLGKVYSYPTSFWGESSTSTETGGDGDTEADGCIDCVQLDEIVIVGYLNPVDPYAELDGYFNPVNEFTDIDNEIESESGGTTGISVSTTEDVTTAIVIEPIVKCKLGEILINGNCVIDTETPCEQEGYVRNENGICVSTVLVENPDDPITDIQDFLNCFDSTQNATLTLYVSEPNPGSGDAYNGTFVGHTFVSINQGNNTSVFGFYPTSNWISPANTTSNSVLGNDGSGTEYFSASISTTISSGQLQQIIDFSTNHNTTYNLDTYNCTDFGIDIGNLGGLNLPECNGKWPGGGGGGGSNPGTLGMFIRNNSSSGTNTTGGNAPSTHKDC